MQLFGTGCLATLCCLFLAAIWLGYRHAAHRERVRLGYAVGLSLVTLLLIVWFLFAVNPVGTSAGADVLASRPFQRVATISVLCALSTSALNLSWIDLREHRLPNPMVLQVSLVAMASLVVLGVFFAQWTMILVWLGAASVVSLASVIVSLLVPKLLGMGDAKLVFAIALALAPQGLVSALTGVYVSLLLAGVVSLCLLLRRNRTPRSALNQSDRASLTPSQQPIRSWGDQLAFGPFLLLMPWCAWWFGPSMVDLLGAI